jgi:light-harvesting complex I chlorophyll a/b binding protein 1
MLASTGIIVAENYNPLFGGSITGTAVNQFQQVPQPFWEIIALTIGIAEAYRVAKGWEDPNKGIFTLRDSYSPGDVGYDPLGIRPENEVELFDLQTKELNNGRLAMIATLAMVVQEEVSKLPIFAELEGGYVADESFLPGAPGIAF